MLAIKLVLCLKFMMLVIVISCLPVCMIFEKCGFSLLFQIRFLFVDLRLMINLKRKDLGAFMHGEWC
ncbi:hypothetical protein RIF29_24359 [Crotalaria pallida]|uniref:Uncharacterized protein n=1 Tax=Crotalaria pallida TaxID=3830 RepID=A0AAN9HYU0_CROPI